MRIQVLNMTSQQSEIVIRIQLEYPPPPTPPTTDPDTPLLYKVADAARLLAIGESVVYELIARGELDSLKIGHSRRIERAAIERYIARAELRDRDVGAFTA